MNIFGLNPFLLLLSRVGKTIYFTNYSEFSLAAGRHDPRAVWPQSHPNYKVNPRRLYRHNLIMSKQNTNKTLRCWKTENMDQMHENLKVTTVVEGHSMGRMLRWLLMFTNDQCSLKLQGSFWFFSSFKESLILKHNECYALVKYIQMTNTKSTPRSYLSYSPFAESVNT